MKTRTYHLNNLGKFAPIKASKDSMGYVTYHDSPRYESATPDQLVQWCGSRIQAIRNAALTELAERSLKEWRKQ